MPRAFLMHYQKKQNSGLMYPPPILPAEEVKPIAEFQHRIHQSTSASMAPENLTRADMALHNSENKLGISQLNSYQEEEEEISVTDEDESDAADEEELDEDEMDDEEDEEINIDDCDYELHNARFKLSDNNLSENSSVNMESMESLRVKLDTTTLRHRNDNKCVRTENNLNQIGSKHSAFSRLSSAEHENPSNETLSPTKPDEHSTSFPGISRNYNGYPDPRLSIANYWMQMNRMYNGTIPPFHPLSAGINNPGAIHLDNNMCHRELIHRQMLHNQMLYIHGHGTLPPGHPLNSIYPALHPGMPPLLIPDIDSSNKARTEHISPSSYLHTNKEKSERLHKHSLLHFQQRYPLFANSSISTQTIDNHKREKEAMHRSHAAPVLQLAFPPGVLPQSPLPSPLSPVMSPQLTPPLSSPMSPQAMFGSPPMHPMFYGNVFGIGARRPRDPNKPPPVKKYKCDICGKAFSRSNTLVTHRRIHTGEKPFKCEVCSRAFRQPGNLTRHRLTHTTVKPYVCVVCKKAFNRASNLHTHMRTHTAFRPFLCPYCGKGFQQKVDLKIHMYTHGGGRQ